MVLLDFAMNAIPARATSVRDEAASRPIARLRPSDHLIRAVAANMLQTIEGSGGAQVDALIGRHWPKDEVTPLVLRAATNPATMTTSGWASQLAGTSVADFLLGMGCVGRFGPARARAVAVVRWLRSIFLPSMLSAAGLAAFVMEGAPIPVEQPVAGGVTLTPRALKTITVFTREIFEHSVPNVEKMVGAVLRESIGHQLDVALLDATAGDAVRPAGLRNGISTVVASALTPASEAMNRISPT